MEEEILEIPSLIEEENNEEETLTPSEKESAGEEIIDENFVEEFPFWYGYRILNEENIEIENPDLELGYLQKEILTIHHPAIPVQGHYKVTSIGLSDGTTYYPIDNDPYVTITDPHNGYWVYNAPEPSTHEEEYEDENGEIQTRIITDPVPHPINSCVSYIIDVPAREAYDTQETIYRYILFTEKQLADNIFLAKGPERLNTAEESINDVIEVVADLAGSDIEERISEEEETLEDLLLTIAEMLGGADEEYEEEVEV